MSLASVLQKPKHFEEEAKGMGKIEVSRGSFGLESNLPRVLGKGRNLGLAR